MCPTIVFIANAKSTMPDDHRKMGVRVEVAGEGDAFWALAFVKYPLAADREEVEVREPERGGDEEPEDRGRRPHPSRGSIPSRRSRWR